MSHFLRAAVAALTAAALLPAAVAAQTIRYALTGESRIVPVCRECETAPPSEALGGSFDLTVLPAGGAYGAEALTAVSWESESFQITGAGFLQRIGGDRLAMVVDARINSAPALLTSGRRQRSTPGEIRIRLSTPRADGSGYRIDLVAVPVMTDGPDADGDRVPDSVDNCPNLPTADQNDADHDGVGDVCDVCPDTSLGSPVSSGGCAPSQQCACEGPSEDEEWDSPRAYVMCIARELKQLRRESNLSRREIRRMMHDAVRSGCGRRVVALR